MRPDDTDPITAAAELLHAAVLVRIEAAVIEANGGRRPTPDEARRRGNIVYPADGSMRVMWDAKEVFALQRGELTFAKAVGGQ